MCVHGRLKAARKFEGKPRVANFDRGIETESFSEKRQFAANRPSAIRIVELNAHVSLIERTTRANLTRFGIEDENVFSHTRAGVRNDNRV